MTDWLLSRLTRRTSTGRFIPEIDGLRFVSIAAVVIFHLSGFLQVAAGVPAGDVGLVGGPVERLAATGHYGVQLFFIISGFVLALPFGMQHLEAGQPVRLRSYLLRRLTRLEPPYVLCMVLCFGLLVVRNHQSPSELVPGLSASLVYLHNLIYAAPSQINTVAWSLEVEVQFYLLAPVLCLAFRIADARVRRGVLVAAIVAVSMLQLGWMQPDTRWAMSLPGQLQYFLTGLLLADLYITHWKQAPPLAARWDLVSLLGWPLLAATWLSRSSSFVVFPWLALALFCAAFRGPWSRRVFRNPWIVVIGGMCYTIYLLHYPLLSAVGRSLQGISADQSFAVHLLVQAALFIPVLLLICGVYFVLIERPCMDRHWPQKLAARFRSRRFSGG